MTNNYATYKLSRRPSVEEVVDQPEGSYYHQLGYPEQRFFTQKKINFNNHHRYHSGLKPPAGYKNLVINSIEHIEDQQLQYSQTQLQNEMLQTLQDLGIRRGHSFQKQRIDFSLSSDVLNTQHENQILKKKMNEMKKQLQYLRENDQKLAGQLWQQKIKNSKLQTQLSQLKNQFVEQKQKASRLEQYLKIKEQTLKEMVNTTPVKTNSEDEKKVDGLLDQLQNLKKLTQAYECEIQKIKEHYQNQLSNKTAALQKQLEMVHSQFANAKEVGQQQINKLLRILFQKDKEILMMKEKQKESSERKKSTLMSDNPDTFRHHKRGHSYYQEPEQQYHRNPFIERFLKFQRLIDEKIRNNKVKERKNGERISKSVIAGKKEGREQSEIRLNQLQRQSNNLSQLLQKNERMKYPDAIMERSHTDSNRF